LKAFTRRVAEFDGKTIRKLACGEFLAAIDTRSFKSFKNVYLGLYTLIRPSFCKLYFAK
jgi:hypothetical protein